MFEGLDGTFSGQGAVVVGGNELEFTPRCIAKVAAHIRIYLVVKTADSWRACCMFAEVVRDILVSGKVGRASLILHRSEMDAVVVYADEDMLGTPV
jgi:hypothetical protein